MHVPSNLFLLFLIFLSKMWLFGNCNFRCPAACKCYNFWAANVLLLGVVGWKNNFCCHVLTGRGIILRWKIFLINFSINEVWYWRLCKLQNYLSYTKKDYQSYKNSKLEENICNFQFENDCSKIEKYIEILSHNRFFCSSLVLA